MSIETATRAAVGSSALFGDVFALVIEDRHSDTGVEVWTDRDAAIARAKALATEYAGYNGGQVEEKTIQGWEYYACYSYENDSVRVVKVKLQSPNAGAGQPLAPTAGSARTWMAGMALNGLLHSAAYGGELKRIFDQDSTIAGAGDDRETPQHYTARIALSLADAMMEALQEPNDQAHPTAAGGTGGAQRKESK